ncbi:replication protein P [Cedecea neteri]|nr:replication protein P [Cedecea neteri]WNJ81653.1 replication protein P [Cedecea neteri]
MTSDQMTNVCNACIERCAAGNNWPPDFAEFVGLVAEAGGGRLNLTTANVLEELTRWRNESYKYGSSEQFPWRHPVLYHICVEIRRTGVERKLTAGEQERLAGNLLQKWEKKITAGFSIPPIRRQIAAPKAPAGPTPAQEMFEEYKRRKAAGSTG